MSTSPVKVLFGVTVVLCFQALLVGGEITEVNIFGDSFQQDDPSVSYAECNGFLAGPLIYSGCLLGNLATFFLEANELISLFKAAINAFGIFLGLMTFNVPGAPFWVRMPVAMVVVGSSVWSLVTLMRGGAN